MAELQKGTPVDLGASVGHYDSPGTGLSADGVDGRSSQSPLSAARGNADPTNVSSGGGSQGMKG